MMNLNWLFIPTFLVALLLFSVGRQSIRRCQTQKRRICIFTIWILMGLPGVLMVLYYLHWFDDAKWFYEFRSFPFSELTAAGVGLFAGALAELAGGSRRISSPFLMTILFLGIVVPYIKPLVTPIPSNRFSDRWQDEVCLQSTSSSCGAASAATVFRALGLSLREQDIARECFTSLGGTENWYIARAFGRRRCLVNYRIGEGLPSDLQTPAIAGVRVGGAGHFIAIISSTNGMYVTGDPLVGKQTVPSNQITKVFDFTGFFMECQKDF
jgi:hypothetical protein